jgi:putative protein-disulfide isomerase
VSRLRVRYYTDPACPWSWALEPAFRRLLVEFGDELAIEYVIGGMGEEFEDPSHFAFQVLQAGEQSGMPVDARPWLEDPPRNSQPAGMAVKAAAEQGDPGPYLRRLREGFFCRGLKLENIDSLLAEARAVGSLDLERLRIGLASHGVLELLGRDLELARAVPSGHHASGKGRVQLPSLEFVGEDGERRGVYGFSAFEPLRQAALQAGAVGGSASPSIEEALGRFGTMTTAEVSEVCQLPGPLAPATLWRLAAEWRVRSERCGGGELWSLA